MKAIILARVSTKDQEEYGYSLPAQVARLQQYAQKHDFQITREFVFSESAGLKIREKFEEVLRYLRANKEVRVLLCQNVDRVTRNFRDAVDLDEMRIKDNLHIHFVQDGFSIHAKSTGNDLFMWESKVFLAKQYINRLADDSKRSMYHKLENGQCIHKAPVGYLNTLDPQTGRRTVIVDEERAFLVRRMFEDYATGLYSTKEIARRAKEWGLRSNTAYAKPFVHSQICTILQNPFYCGYMRIMGKDYRHNYPHLIEKWLFNDCQRVRLSYKKKPFKYAGKPFILRGLIRCGHCGCAYSSDLKKGKYVYLRPTRSKGDCTCKAMRQDEIVAQIKDALMDLVIPNQVLEALKNTLQASLEEKMAQHNKAVLRLQKEHLEIQIKLDRLLDVRINGSITQEEHDRKAGELKEQQYHLHRQLQSHMEADEAFTFSLSTLLNLASRAGELFDSSEIDEKREIVGLVFTNLEIRDGNLCYTRRKPFDLFAEMGKTENWLRR